MSVFDGNSMKDDIVSRLLGGEADLETNRYLDRLVELSLVEEAEHQFLIDPFDRSVALVFQMFHNTDLDPWDVDLSVFLELFNQRINESENIDLPTCGRLVGWPGQFSVAARPFPKATHAPNARPHAPPSVSAPADRR